jgi:ADP-heptose:LPS heptosyltransferase
MGRLRVRAKAVSTRASVLVHLASGIGNIVLATPLLRVLDRNGFDVDVVLDADYPGIGSLFKGWSVVRNIHSAPDHHRFLHLYRHVLAAIPPFYWKGYARRYSCAQAQLFRPPDCLFYRDEQRYYLEFARSLGCDISDPPYYFLPVTSDQNIRSSASTLVLAPGCKTGEMAAKRWPYFPELADKFRNVTVIGTSDDLIRFDGSPMRFSDHVTLLVDQLSLKETATCVASAAAVVANDSGLGHVAGAVGVPTKLIFGPTGHLSLGRFPPNVTILRRGLSCEPCWFARRFQACSGEVTCLRELSAEDVAVSVADDINVASCDNIGPGV